jgi:hypothetical protein
VHHRRADTQCDRGQDTGEQWAVQQREDEHEPGGLHDHAGDDQRCAADAVGEVAGRDLPDPPQDRVQPLDQPDDREPEPVIGEQQREHTPRQAVVEVVHQPCLARATQ